MPDDPVVDPPQPSGGAPDPEGNPNPEQPRGGLTLDEFRKELDKRDRQWAAQLRTAIKGAKSDPKPDPIADPDTDPDDDDTPAPGKPKSTADKKRDAKIAQLEKALQDERAEREREKARREDEARDDKLRALIRKEAVRDVEATFRIVRADLKTDEEGEFAGEVDGATVGAGEVLAATLKANPWLKKPADRDGGGGTPPAAPGSAGAQEYDEKLSPSANLGRALAQSTKQQK